MPPSQGCWLLSQFKIGRNQYVVAQHSDGAYVLPAGSIAGVNSRPAKPGEIMVIYGVGFGAVTPNIAAGANRDAENHISESLQILFGPTPAQLTYFGLAPNLVGLYQFELIVPQVADSDLVPLTFDVGGMAGTQTFLRQCSNSCLHRGIHFVDHAQRVFANRAHECFARDIGIAKRVGDSAGRIHDRAETVIIEAFGRGFRAAALRAVARNQDQGLVASMSASGGLLQETSRRSPPQWSCSPTRQPSHRPNSFKTPAIFSYSGRPVVRPASGLRNPSIRDWTFSKRRTNLCHASCRLRQRAPDCRAPGTGLR